MQESFTYIYYYMLLEWQFSQTTWREKNVDSRPSFFYIFRSVFMLSRGCNIFLCLYTSIYPASPRTYQIFRKLLQWSARPCLCSYPHHAHTLSVNMAIDYTFNLFLFWFSTSIGVCMHVCRHALQLPARCVCVCVRAVVVSSNNWIAVHLRSQM